MSKNVGIDITTYVERARLVKYRAVRIRRNTIDSVKGRLYYGIYRDRPQNSASFECHVLLLAL